MTFDLKFTEQEMQILNMALGEIPYKFAAPLVQSINEQLRKQRTDEGIEQKPDDEKES